MPQTIFTTCYPTSVYLCNSTVPPRAQGKHSSSELWVGADLLINILSWSVFYFDSVCVCVCVCAHLVSHLRCDLYSYNYSWSVSCQVMTFTFMHESDKDAEQHILKHTFVMSCSGIIYHHRGNKGIALLHECGQNGTECIRVTLRTTCTNYLKTQQSTDRIQTSHHATFQASSCGNILVVQASTKSSLNGNASHSFLCVPLRVLVWYWLFPVLKASYFTVRQRRRWPSHLSVMVCDWHDCCAVSVCLSASFYSTATSLIPSLSACFPTLVF